MLGTHILMWYHQRPGPTCPQKCAKLWPNEPYGPNGVLVPESRAPRQREGDVGALSLCPAVTRTGSVCGGLDSPTARQQELPGHVTAFWGLQLNDSTNKPLMQPKWVLSCPCSSDNKGKKEP